MYNIKNNITIPNIINQKKVGNPISKTTKFTSNNNFKLVNNINNNDRIKKDNLNIQNKKACNLKTKAKNCIKINNINIYKNNNKNISYIKVSNNNSSILNFRNSNYKKMNKTNFFKQIQNLKTLGSINNSKMLDIKKKLNYRPIMYKPIYDSSLSYKIERPKLNCILLKPNKNYDEISGHFIDIDKFKNVNRKYSPEGRFTSNSNSRTRLCYKPELYNSPLFEKNSSTCNNSPKNRIRF